MKEKTKGLFKWLMKFLTMFLKAVGVFVVAITIIIFTGLALYVAFLPYNAIAPGSAFSDFLTLREGINWIMVVQLLILALAIAAILFVIFVFITEKCTEGLSNQKLKFIALLIFFSSILVFIMFVFDSNQFSTFAAVLSIVVLANSFSDSKSK